MTKQTIKRFDRTGRLLQTGDSIRFQYTSGRYGQTKITETTVKDATVSTPWQVTMSGNYPDFDVYYGRDDQRKYLTDATEIDAALADPSVLVLIGFHTHYDYEHGHETWVEILANEDEAVEPVVGANDYTTYNIPEDIGVFATQFDKLEGIATGGNVDYVFRKFDNGCEGLVACAEDAGSPDSLADKARVSIYNNWGWYDSDTSEDPNDKGLHVEFDTAREAVEYLANCECPFDRFFDDGEEVTLEEVNAKAFNPFDAKTFANPVADFTEDRSDAADLSGWVRVHPTLAVDVLFEDGKPVRLCVPNGLSEDGDYEVERVMENLSKAFPDYALNVLTWEAAENGTSVCSFGRIVDGEVQNADEQAREREPELKKFQVVIVEQYIITVDATDKDDAWDRAVNRDEGKRETILFDTHDVYEVQ